MTLQERKWARARLKKIHKDILDRKTKLKSDSVHHPSHYNTGNIEVIDAIEDWKLDFHLGNVVKYVARADHKGNKLQDLKKSLWYLNRAIENCGRSTTTT